MSRPDLTTLATLGALALSLAALLISFFSRRRLVADRDGVDRRIDELSRLVVTLAANLPAASPPGPSPLPSPSGPANRSRRVDRAEAAVPPGPTLITVPNLATAGEASLPDPADSELGRRYAAIWEQSEAGVSADEIAQATGQPIGQVELILGLKRRISSTGGPRAS